MSKKFIPTTPAVKPPVVQPPMDYLQLLEHSFKVHNECHSNCPSASRLDFVGGQIFDFTTYNSEVSAVFAAKAIEVCHAISEGTTFEYIKDESNHYWYLLMCNMPFIASKINWGVSIRGAFWDQPLRETHFVVDSCGLWKGADQLGQLRLTREGWQLFVKALEEFTADECAAFSHKPLLVVKPYFYPQ